VLADELPLWSVLPFVGLLLSIAVLPMVVGGWWHHVRNQLLVSVAWAAPVLLGLLWLAWSDGGEVGHGASHALGHAAEEYVSFVCLLGSLYVVAGGVLLRGDLEGRPVVNTAFLAAGTVLANLIGTTGASMLLIGPVLRTNSERRHVWHIPVFFIFLVSNVGGALTPIGDPPLFLGYLRGVPFFWTLTHLWPMWVPVAGVLLLVFFVLDTVQYGRETSREIQADVGHVEPLRLEGSVNLLLLAGVVASVLFLSPDPAVHDVRDWYVREFAMVGLAGLSLAVTPRVIRAGNAFSWSPILEVAVLFFGIFLAMIPVAEILRARGGALGVTEPLQYFWATGALSAFLDNAPTYVVFAAMACGNFPSCQSAEDLGSLTTHPDSAAVLAAISLGAVFMGAGSYIGNGPNFMVRAIAVRSGYAMPSFLAYCGLAALFLGPVFLAMTLLAFG
jgi:Na+/H+ antiporter NhaD/arsenite permease-like protein